MTDRNDRTTNRPIPPPPGRAVPDDDVVAVAREFEATAEPTPREQREAFAEARRALVDKYVDASGGALNFQAFHKAKISEFDDIAAEHGVRPWGDLRSENEALRSALAAEVVGRHRHVTADDLADVLASDRSFDLDSVLARAAEISQERAEGARGLLTEALRDAGLNVDAEGFDALAVLQAAAQPKTEPAELPDGVFLSTPAFRTANLPSGRQTSIPKRWNDAGDLTGMAQLEAAAAEFLADEKH